MKQFQLRNITHLFKILILAGAFLFIGGVCYAAWDFEATIPLRADWTNKQKIHVITLDYVSDGADPAEISLSTYLTTSQLNTIQGGLFYAIKHDGDDVATPSTFTVAFDDEDGADLFSLTTTETSKAEWFPVTDLAKNIPIWDIQIDFGDVGDNLDAGTLFIYIVR